MRLYNTKFSEGMVLFYTPLKTENSFEHRKTTAFSVKLKIFNSLNTRAVAAQELLAKYFS